MELGDRKKMFSFRRVGPRSKLVLVFAAEMSGVAEAVSSLGVMRFRYRPYHLRYFGDYISCKVPAHLHLFSCSPVPLPISGGMAYDCLLE